jgi:hypothetical protein
MTRSSGKTVVSVSSGPIRPSSLMPGALVLDSNWILTYDRGDSAPAHMGADGRIADSVHGHTWSGDQTSHVHDRIQFAKE